MKNNFWKVLFLSLVIMVAGAPCAQSSSPEEKAGEADDALAAQPLAPAKSRQFLIPDALFDDIFTRKPSKKDFKYPLVFNPLPPTPHVWTLERDPKSSDYRDQFEFIEFLREGEEARQCLTTINRASFLMFAAGTYQGLLNLKKRLGGPIPIPNSIFLLDPSLGSKTGVYVWDPSVDAIVTRKPLEMNPLPTPYAFSGEVEGGHCSTTTNATSPLISPAGTLDGILDSKKRVGGKSPNSDFLPYISFGIKAGIYVSDLSVDYTIKKADS